MLDTNSEISLKYNASLRTIEIVSTIIFSIEYILRFWSCATRAAYKARIKGRIKWMLTPLAIIDLIAILPFYLTLFGFDPEIAHMLSLVRILRITKLVRYSRSLKMISNVLKFSRKELYIAFLLIALLTTIASALMYLVEHKKQPEHFGDIFNAMWWTVMTITNVGYGDVVPKTAIGQVLGSLVAILGIAVFALPTAILGASFMREIQHRKTPKFSDCPHCGKNLERKPALRRKVDNL